MIVKISIVKRQKIWAKKFKDVQEEMELRQRMSDMVEDVRMFDQETKLLPAGKQRVPESGLVVKNPIIWIINGTQF